MKKIFLSLVALIFACGINAQKVKVMKGDTVLALFTSSQYNKVVFEEEEDSLEMVDLGISVKWAAMNLGATNGATKESWYGDYFAWGETDGYTTDTLDGRLFNWASYKWMADGQSDWMYINKYTCPDKKTNAIWYDELGRFIGDNKIILESADDAVTSKLGGSYRMPTKENINDLLQYCTWTWTANYNGISGLFGYLITSNVDGYTDKSIFLPAAGYRNGSTLAAPSVLGYYWTSSLYGFSYKANIIYFNSLVKKCENEYRYLGCPVRPVELKYE